MLASRHILLPGCLNFRDIGGYPTRYGRSTAWRRLYRGGAISGHDSAEAGDLCQTLGLRRVVDLRTTGETRERLENVLPVSCKRLHLPLFPVIRSSWVYPADKSPTAAAGRYLEMFHDGLATILRIVEELQDVDVNPTLVHCAVGRDRTGIVTACLLDLLEVPEELIAEDYAFSDNAIKDGERAHADTIVLFLRMIRDTHGSTRAALLSRGASRPVLEKFGRAILE